MKFVQTIVIAGGMLAIGVGTLAASACSSSKPKETPPPQTTASPNATLSSASTTASASPTPARSETPDAVTPTDSTTEPPAYDDSSDPVRMLASYVNAINRHEYQRAYGYWRNPSQSFDAFKQGYANTAAVVSSLRPASGVDAGAGQRRVLIAAVLQSTLTDGTHQEFAGCYVAWRTADGISSNPADSLWHIEEATVKETQTASLNELLGDACTGYKDRVSAYGAAYDDQSGALNLVLSLYDAVNRKDYQRAFGYWEQAPTDYAHFAAGYGATQSVAVTAGSPRGKGAAAGSVYTSVPVILTVTNTDGSVHVFSGCYEARRSNIPPAGKTDPSGNPWTIYGAQIAAASSNADPAALLADACPNAQN